MYAWWGFIDCEGKRRLQSIITKAIKQGFLPSCQPSFDEVCNAIDLGLFKSILNNPNHVFHHQLPPIGENLHNLRPRTHDRSIPMIKDSFTKHSSHV